MRRPISFLIHLLAVSNFAITIYGQLFGGGVPREVTEQIPEMGLDKFGGPWKYLTFWNLWIQLVYFSICLVNDILGRKKSSSLTKVEDFTYATLAFPIGMFVAVVFWILFAVDRELVFPLILDQYITPLINHMMHTFVVPFQLIELLLISHKYPSRIVGAGTTISFLLIYLVWTLVVAHFGGFWIYPILGKLKLIPRIIFLTVCSLYGGCLYWLGEKLDSLIGYKSEAKTRSKTKKNKRK